MPIINTNSITYTLRANNNNNKMHSYIKKINDIGNAITRLNNIEDYWNVSNYTNEIIKYNWDYITQ